MTVRIPISRLNEFTRAVMLEYDPGELTEAEREFYDSIKAQHEREPDVAFSLVDE